jgi:hypothetical protein
VTAARGVRLVALAAALAIMIALVARLGPAALLDELDQVGVSAAWLLVLYAAGTTLGAFPYYVLFPPAIRPSLRSAIVSRFAASGINIIIPLFGVGGEPTRLLWLPPEHRAAGVAAILVDRLTYAVASALFLVGGTLAAIELADLPSSYTVGGLFTAFSLFLFAGIAIWLVGRHRFGGRLHRLVSRLRRRSHAGRQFGDDLDTEIEAIVRRRPSLVLAILLGLAARFVLGAELFIAFRLLDVHLSASAAYTFAVVPVLLAVVGAVVPGQLGIQEGSQALVAQSLGFDPSTAVAAVLLTRVRQLLTAAIAWVLIATARPPRTPTNSASSAGPSSAGPGFRSPNSTPSAEPIRSANRS